MINPLELLTSLFAPESCLCCGSYGDILCEECASTFYYPDRCFACKKPSLAGETCQKCKKKTPIAMQVVVASYQGVAKDVIKHMKYGPSRSAARRAGLLIAGKLPFIDLSSCVICPLPTSSQRRRFRGFDQAQIMASTVAIKSKLPLRRIILREGSVHQVGASRKERLQHGVGLFSLLKHNEIKDKTVVLIDDVVTTGATMQSAAKLVHDAGAKYVIAAYFVRAE